MTISVQTLRRFSMAAILLGMPFAAFAAPAGLPGPDGGKELDAIQSDIGRFEEANKDYRGTLAHVVQQEYITKRKQLMSKYQTQLDFEEKDEKQRRESAIKLFEDFLVRYHNDDRWTPDAMFRLAELYFEKSNDEYLTATTMAQASGAQITPDYGKTIALYRELIGRFPDYRLIDGAYYLLGWCLGEMNKEGESLQAMRALVCNNKFKPLDAPTPPQPSKGKGIKVENPYHECVPVKADSRFLPEAWTRIGEYHFDNSELELAIAAYSRVLDFTDSPYYDKALYKLAWSYYRADNYPDAIKRFDQLVVFSDKKKAESGAEGSDLRTEAVQYLGISFAEKDWNGDSIDDVETGLERAEKFYRGRESEPHVREIYAKLGDIYFDETEYFRAIEAYKRALQKWPYHPDNPKLQDRIVMAFERMRDFGHALEEREALARNYTKGTEWYKHNRDNEPAIQTAQDLAELALVSAAVNHHKAAQDLKKLAQAQKKPESKLVDQIQREYKLAAEAYEKYLEQYPNSRNTYEYSYSYAETLYYSGRFRDAAEAYEKVRDSKLDNKYVEDASFNAVKSYEMALAELQQKGAYTEPPVPAVGKTVVPVTPIQEPDLVQHLQKAYDQFTTRVPGSGRVPTMTYKAAEIPLRYLHWDEARPRMEQIVTKYCKDDLGANAGQAILATYTIEKNLDKIEEWANRLKAANCGSTVTAAKNATELGKLSLGVKFQKADQLFADKKYEEAARLYVQIIDADPHSEDADKALNNAAVAYENVKRYAAATRLYERIVNDYPTSKFLDDALFRTAVSYQKAFEFDRAEVSYVRLAEDKKFAASPHRNDALYNAAIILENDQNYAKASELFKKYAADKGVKREDASEAFFRSAMNLEKLHDWDRAIKTFADYVKTYGNDPKGRDRVLEAYFREATSYEQKHDKAAAEAMYKKIVSLGTTAAPASEQAEFPAHAAFILTEQKLPAVEKAKITGGGKQLAASIQRFKTSVSDLVTDYNKVIAYRRATWTLAAYFRTGYLYELFSKALLNAPCPPEVKRLGAEACDIYRDQIEQTVAGVDEEAVKRYGVTLQQAGNLGVSNEWTRLARTRANAYKPDVFPMTKDEHIDLQLESP
jgi:tetratricopeptide (TPR) repeat protein